MKQHIFINHLNFLITASSLLLVLFCYSFFSIVVAQSCNFEALSVFTPDQNSRSFVITPDNKYIIIPQYRTSSTANVRKLDINTGDVVATGSIKQRKVESSAIDASGKFVYFGSTHSNSYEIYKCHASNLTETSNSPLKLELTGGVKYHNILFFVMTEDDFGSNFLFPYAHERNRIFKISISNSDFSIDSSYQFNSTKFPGEQDYNAGIALKHNSPSGSESENFLYLCSGSTSSTPKAAAVTKIAVVNMSRVAGYSRNSSPKKYLSIVASQDSNTIYVGGFKNFGAAIFKFRVGWSIFEFTSLKIFAEQNKARVMVFDNFYGKNHLYYGTDGLSSEMIYKMSISGSSGNVSYDSNITLGSSNDALRFSWPKTIYNSTRRQRIAYYLSFQSGKIVRICVDDGTTTTTTATTTTTTNTTTTSIPTTTSATNSTTTVTNTTTTTVQPTNSTTTTSIASTTSSNTTAINTTTLQNTSTLVTTTVSPTTVASTTNISTTTTTNTSTTQSPTSTTTAITNTTTTAAPTTTSSSTTPTTSSSTITATANTSTSTVMPTTTTTTSFTTETNSTTTDIPSTTTITSQPTQMNTTTEIPSTSTSVSPITTTTAYPTSSTTILEQNTSSSSSAATTTLPPETISTSTTPPTTTFTTATKTELTAPPILSSSSTTTTIIPTTPSTTETTTTTMLVPTSSSSSNVTSMNDTTTTTTTTVLVTTTIVPNTTTLNTSTTTTSEPPPQTTTSSTETSSSTTTTTTTTIPPAPTLLPAKLKAEAAATTSMGMVGSPTAAKITRSLIAVGSLARCSRGFQDNISYHLKVPPLGRDTNILGIYIGEDVFAGYRGAMVGTFVFINIFLAAGFLFAFARSKLRHTTFDIALQKTHFPSPVALPLAALVAPTAMSAGVVAMDERVQSRPGDVMLLLFTFCYCWIPVGVYIWIGKRLHDEKVTCDPIDDEGVPQRKKYFEKWNKERMITEERARTKHMNVTNKKNNNNNNNENEKHQKNENEEEWSYKRPITDSDSFKELSFQVSRIMWYVDWCTQPTREWRRTSIVMKSRYCLENFSEKFMPAFDLFVAATVSLVAGIAGGCRKKSCCLGCSFTVMLVCGSHLSCLLYYKVCTVRFDKVALPLLSSLTFVMSLLGLIAEFVAEDQVDGILDIVDEILFISFYVAMSIIVVSTFANFLIPLIRSIILSILGKFEEKLTETEKELLEFKKKRREAAEAKRLAAADEQMEKNKSPLLLDAGAVVATPTSEEEEMTCAKSKKNKKRNFEIPSLLSSSPKAVPDHLTSLFSPNTRYDFDNEEGITTATIDDDFQQPLLFQQAATTSPNHNNNNSSNKKKSFSTVDDAAARFGVNLPILSAAAIRRRNPSTTNTTNLQQQEKSKFLSDFGAETEEIDDLHPHLLATSFAEKTRKLEATREEQLKQQKLQELRDKREHEEKKQQQKEQLRKERIAKKQQEIKQKKEELAHRILDVLEASDAKNSSSSSNNNNNNVMKNNTEEGDHDNVNIKERVARRVLERNPSAGEAMRMNNNNTNNHQHQQFSLQLTAPKNEQEEILDAAMKHLTSAGSPTTTTKATTMKNINDGNGSNNNNSRTLSAAELHLGLGSSIFDPEETNNNDKNESTTTAAAATTKRKNKNNEVNSDFDDQEENERISELESNNSSDDLDPSMYEGL